MLFRLLVETKCLQDIFDDLTELSSLEIAAMCVGLYLMGFITQSIIQQFFGGDFLGTGLGEVAEYIRFYPTRWLNRRGYPDWLYWSDKPSRVLEIYRNILETDEGAETKTEFLYSNQLFQGTAFAILFTTVYGYLESFCCLAGFWKGAIVVILFVVLWLIHWFCGQTKKVIIPITLGYFVPLLLALPYLGQYIFNHKSYPVALIIILSYILVSWLAASLARRQIRRIDILARFNKENEKRFNEVLARVGIPKVYILTRTNSAAYISEELQTISKQTYPNIKVIILFDSSLQIVENKEEHKKLHGAIDKFRDRLSIQTYESENSGPAALAHEIRQIFLNYANSDDIAIMLDSDDKLYSPSVVSQVVTKMFRTESNICLIRFEVFGKQKLNYAKNYHNDLVKKLCYKNGVYKSGYVLEEEQKKRRKNGPNTALNDIFMDQAEKGGEKPERNESITAQEFYDGGEAHRISTIGWTKCYQKGILEEYHNMITDYLKSVKINFKSKSITGIDKILEKCTKYEDFPDIAALLLKSAKICAVAKNSVLFRKSPNSVTTGVTEDNYSVQIPFFLKFAKELSEQNLDKMIAMKDNDNAVIDRLIPYKFVQYLNVVYKKTHEPGNDSALKDYSCIRYYRDFTKIVFGIDISSESTKVEQSQTLERFHSNIARVFSCYDYKILIEGDPKIPNVERGAKWPDICSAYELKDKVAA